jgi:gliding motility-associated-like protein
MIDAAGSAVITGSSTNYRQDFTSYGDPFVIRINPTNGDTLWTRIITPSDDYSDNASSIDLDANGNYLISAAVMSYSGFTEGFVPNKHAIYKMSQGGNLQMARILNSGGSHYPSLTALANGDVLYSGFSNQYTEPCCNFEPLLIRMASNLQSGCNENDVFAQTTTQIVNWQVEVPGFEESSGFSASEISGSDVFNFDSINTLCSDIPALEASFIWDNFCAGLPLNFTDTSSGSPISWTWDFGEGPVIGGPEETHVFNEAGTYPVTLEVSNGCAQSTITLDIIIQDGPFADAGLDQTIFAGESITIGGDPTGPDGFFYSWEPAESLDNPNSPNPVASPMETTLYTVTVNEFEGCPSESNILITVLDPENPDSLVYGEHFIPNIFSPNEDQLNDLLMVYGGPYSEMVLEIFDRWGTMVFRSTDQLMGWDGKHRGQEAQTGVYYYQFKGLSVWDESIESKGNITLIR